MFEVSISKGVIQEATKGEECRVWYLGSSVVSDVTPNPLPTQSFLVSNVNGVLHLGGFVEFCKKPQDRDMWVKDTIIEDAVNGVVTQYFFKPVGGAGNLDFENRVISLKNYPCEVLPFNSKKSGQYIKDELLKVINKVVVYYTNNEQREKGLRHLSVLEGGLKDNNFPSINMLSVIL